MSIDRQIDIFDNETELLVQEVPIKTFDLERFKERFNVKDEDPLMYDPYEITIETIDLFPYVSFDFQKFSYFIGCYHVKK
jgi:hypothetical protein